MRANRVGEFLAGRAWPASELAGRINRILAADRADDFRDGDIELGQLVGLYPNAHRILPGAEDLHLRYARHPAQRVAEVDVGVVGEEVRVTCAVGRVKRHENEIRLPSR